MSEDDGLSTRIRNLSIYMVGVGLAAAGAMGMIGFLPVHTAISGLLFVAGLLLVVFVHERLGGPF